MIRKFKRWYYWQEMMIWALSESHTNAHYGSAYLREYYWRYYQRLRKLK